MLNRVLVMAMAVCFGLPLCETASAQGPAFGGRGPEEGRRGLVVSVRKSEYRAFDLLGCIKEALVKR